MAAKMGRVVSVNVGQPRTVEFKGRTVTTAIFKVPLAGKVPLRGVNLRGDDQADRGVHGGPDRAVYAYASEDYAWWRERLARDLTPGTFGENLTTSEINVNGALIGERWRAGTAVLQVRSPRVPCSKLAVVMDDPVFVRTFARGLRFGAYMAIIAEGEIGAGDDVEIVFRPSHALTVSEMGKIVMFEPNRVHELLMVPELTESWREWAFEKTAERERGKASA
ncbi:MAG: MOSC domain-containing protein [Candidatus Eremiobacteraeota bacterium]|nr:MOSC domain-containing protein [Candidatus Eremiobacteraeota bacterium]